MKSILLLPTVAALTLSSASMVSAQNYAIDWWTIDGGGGTSAGGAYSVTGTIGQPDAGTMSGGPYTLVGGFWSVVSVIQTPGSPKLKVVQDTLLGEVTVSWPLPATDFILEQTSDLNTIPGSWMLVPLPTYQTNATDIFIKIPPPLGPKFYRLRHL